ncbi:MAG: cytochrome c biogenesis protein ResB [Chloroflexota bacterium]
MAGARDRLFSPTYPMSESKPPAVTTSASRDPVSLLWRVLASSRMFSLLLLLLAVAVLLTILFSPQRPFASDIDALAQWANEAQARYGRWYDPLVALGVLSVDRSIGLRLLLGLMVWSLAVGLVDTSARVWRAWRRPDVLRPESFFRSALIGDDWRVSMGRQNVVATVARGLAWPFCLWRLRFQVRPSCHEMGQTSYLHQDLFTWRRAASVVLRVGLLLMLVGLGLDARLGWRQENLMLLPGQSAALEQLAGSFLELESVQDVGGQPVSRLRLVGPDGATLAGTAATGRPLTLRGVSIYQQDVGPLLRFSARGAFGEGSGSRITLVDASTHLEPADEAWLVFTESRAEHYVLMPYIQKAVRLVLYRQGGRWDTQRDELLLEVYTRNSEAPEFSQTLVGSGSATLGGVVYEIDWQQYTLLDVVRSVFQWPIRVGMALGLLGLVAVLLIPPIRLWVQVIEEQGGCSIRVAGETPEEPDGEAEYLAVWQRRLKGLTADE